MKKAFLSILFLSCFLPFSFYAQTSTPDDSNKNTKSKSAGKQGKGKKENLSKVGNCCYTKEPVDISDMENEEQTKDDNDEPFCTLGEQKLGKGIDIESVKELPLIVGSVWELPLISPTCVPKKYEVCEKCEIDPAQVYTKEGKYIGQSISVTNSNPYFCRNADTIFIIFRQKAKSVEIVGDFTNWASAGYKLRRLNPSEHYIELEFPKNARIEYKLIVDGKWILDSWNPKKVDNGIGGQNSVLEMPDYRPTRWANSEGMSEPKIETKTVNSKIYGKRKIKVYVPKGFENKRLPVMYLQDGTDYINRASAITIQRNLVKAGNVKPFIMVFIDYKDRMQEYFASDNYSKYLVKEIVPLIDKDYKTVKNRNGRAILGASLGGVTSIWTAMKYPKFFSRIGGQSNAFWIDKERVIKQMSKLKGNKKFRFYIDDGIFEGVLDSKRAVQILKQKGFDVKYVEKQTGHNWTSWKDRLDEAFVFLMN